MSLLKKYPIESFFVITFLLGTSIIFLVFKGIIPSQLALTSALSASIAGIIMTGILQGKSGIKALLNRALIWRVGLGYWLFAGFYIIPAIIIGSLFNPIFIGNPVSFHNLKLSSNILPLFILFLIVAGFGQELGWSGFLLPRLQRRFGAFISSLIRAGLVLIWHMPLLIFLNMQPDAIPDFPYGEWIVQKGFLITFLALVIFSLPWSILYTWIFNNTRGSLLLVSLLHGSEIWLAYLTTRLGINPKNLDNYWGYGMVLILTALIILLVTGSENLSRKYPRFYYDDM
jgi:membrane protease YdiL (CAAX protease family)